MTSFSHPLEKKFNAPAADILEAIEHGFRARVDVRGKLAELYLHRHLERLRADGQIVSIQWHDTDGEPDFEILMQDGRKLRIECKNLRSDKSFSVERGCRVEIQKTRGGIDKEGRKTRGYLANYFDLLAACTFNQTGDWGFRFIAARRLARRADEPGVLKVVQPVPLMGTDKSWFDDFLMAVEDVKD
ncbi:MAG: hypothetical protein ACREP6_08515 [Candidatus Binataceae bacterium]